MTDANRSNSLTVSTNKQDTKEDTKKDAKFTTENSPSDETSQKDKSAKTGGLWFLSIINLLLILLIIGSAYWYYTQVLQNEDDGLLELSENLENQTQQLQNQIRTNNQALTQLEASVSDKNNALSASVDNLLAQVLEYQEINDALKRQINELSGRRPSDWLLAEANYLVNLAGRKLYLEQDLRTAVTLLQEADARLDDLNDPSLLPIRALIASDIQALQQVNPVSTTSLALAISGLLPQVSQLPLELLALPEKSEDETTELSNDISDWQDNLKKVWRDIVGDFMTVRRLDEPLEPFLAQSQQWLIEQQLKFALTQAKTAALNEHFTLYQTSLQRAMALIIEHYQIDTPEVTQFMKALQQLQETNFERDYPSKLNAVDALGDAIERRIERQFNNRDNAL
uniref:uroporphyrinogen-III C-methyltransferase n=1 Tax=Ningiella ruwaisensis TaxID=2364274 RepID=UPI0010A01485|nr:uroporphyrinogen-III C-methyltransferase [Ningiella ruwaisensis]